MNIGEDRDISNKGEVYDIGENKWTEKYVLNVARKWMAVWEFVNSKNEKFIFCFGGIAKGIPYFILIHNI